MIRRILWARRWRRKYGTERIYRKIEVNGLPHTLIGRMEGNNTSDRNTIGLVLYIRPEGGREREVGRVARVRENSLHPEISFEDQVDKVVADAEKMMEVINELDRKVAELTSSAGQLQ